MATGQKRKYVKPQIKFVTDFNIVLECLHEVYGLEKNHIQEGRDIRKTMVHPFVKMLENHCEKITLEEVHEKLWKVYLQISEKELFLSTAGELLQPYKKADEKI